MTISSFDVQGPPYYLVTLALQPPDCPQAVTEGTDIFSFEDPAVKSALLVQAFWGDW